MGRLEDNHVKSLIWKEEADGTIYADAWQYYEIDKNNELAVFQGDKCVKVHELANVAMCIGVAEASEHVCRKNIERGVDGNGYVVNERGWRTGKWVGARR